MRYNKSKQIKLGILLQYIQMGLNIIINLIYTPAMLRILGPTEYGIYGVAGSVISYLNLLTLGFGASYIRFYSRLKKENEVANLNGLYLLIFTVIGFIAFAMGLVISNNITVFFNESYSIQDLNIAKALMIILALNLAISFPSSVFVSYVSSQERFVFQKTLNIVKTVFSPCLALILLFGGLGSIGMAIATTFVSLVTDIINCVFCFKKLHMRIRLDKVDTALLKEVAVFSSFIAINQLIDQINWQTDKIVLGKMANGTAVAVYSVGSTINTMYIHFSTAISSVFTPRVHAIVASDNKDKDTSLTNLLIKVGRVQFFVIALVLTGFILYGRFFIAKWAGQGYQRAYEVALLFMIPMAVCLIQNVAIEIQRAENKHQFRSIVYFFVAIVNVLISIGLCPKYGVLGVAFGTTFSLVIGNIIIMNIFYQLRLGLDMISFWRSIISIFPSIIISFIFGLLLKRIIKLEGIMSFSLVVITYCCAYAISIYLCGLNNYEKNLLRTGYRAVVKRFCNE